MSGVYQALAHPIRRQVLVLLRQRDMTAGELAERFEVTKATMSGHFTVLREAGLVHAERHGASITYRLNASLLEEALMEMLELFGVDAEGTR